MNKSTSLAHVSLYIVVIIITISCPTSVTVDVRVSE